MLNTAKYVSLLLMFFTLTCAEKRYDGYQVLRVSVPDKLAAAKLQDLQINHAIDFWSEIRGDYVDVLIGPDDLELTAIIEKMPHTVLVQDVESVIRKNRIPSPFPDHDQIAKADHKLTFTEYHDLSTIEGYLFYLNATYDFVELEMAGKSYEGRPIWVIKVCQGGCKNSNRPIMWIDATIHAREWLAPASALYSLREIVEYNDRHPHITNAFDWYFMPVVNPDGYEYSFSNDRLWRKNRRPNKDSNCIGTDLNRNFNASWNTGGTSNRPCSEIYHGRFPNSEPEIQILTGYINNLNSNGRVIFSDAMHCCLDIALMPYGYKAEDQPANYDRMKHVFDEAIEALNAVNQKEFTAASITDTFIGVASGGSVDYYYDVTGVPYVTAMEVRTDPNSPAFMIPPEQIIPSGKEIFAFHKSVAEQLMA